MKNIRNTVLLVALLFLITFSFSGCKGFGSPDYTLNVIIEDGCTGTPEAGTYTKNELDEVKYSYFPPEENVVIEVLINNSRRTSSSTVVMYNNITMTIRVIDIRGDWEFTYILENGNEQKMNITFSGDSAFKGTFSDSRGYSGTWTVEADNFVMTYDDWDDYVFTGSVTSMSGLYTGAGISLSWSSTRLN